MDALRRRLFLELGQKIGKTPLVVSGLEVPNGNQILIKRECDNPFGSHYDRVYLELFRYYESVGRIRPGDQLLETSSGSAGVSFAAIGLSLGYDCYVAIPADGEKAREEAIKEYLPEKDHLIFTPAEEYLGGFPEFIRTFLSRNKGFFFMNHSMGKKGKNNELALSALSHIAIEVLRSMSDVDYFVPAIGNGSSVLGVGRKLNAEGTKVIPFETFQSAAMYDLLNPGKYESKFGIKPGTLSRHQLPGTSYQGVDFPHIRNALGLVGKVVLVSDAQMDKEYSELTGRTDSKGLVHWDQIGSLADYGRTTLAGLAVAMELAQGVRNKKILVIAYDKAERYDS